MSKKKVCKKCKLFVEEQECPLCKGKDFTTTWQGRINILDSAKSDIANKMDIHAKGEYSIKIR
tara:strand:- start:308 stop:496 length:189 start_codon:yes stop_codon:yes gene_type:complete